MKQGSKGLSASGTLGLAEWLLTLCCLLLVSAQAVYVLYFLGRLNFLRAGISPFIHSSIITVLYQMPVLFENLGIQDEYDTIPGLILLTALTTSTKLTKHFVSGTQLHAFHT